MTKRFCDLCGKEANADLPMERWGSGRLIENGEHQGAQARVRIVFSFVGHPRGFGGPPDLCEECACALVRGILSEENHDHRQES